ncbi:MAG: hypothetical protein U1A72_06635 [Sulfuritalea sp.]|nr:hypothetical protein [Sulfuritalea sp.]
MPWEHLKLGIERHQYRQELIKGNLFGEPLNAGNSLLRQPELLTQSSLRQALILAQALQEWRQLSSGGDGGTHGSTFSSDKEYLYDMLYSAYCQYILYTAYFDDISYGANGCEESIPGKLRGLSPWQLVLQSDERSFDPFVMDPGAC